MPRIALAAESQLDTVPAKLVIKGLSKAFGGRAGVSAIDNLSLQVRAGEFVSIVGPSGCGKSSLIRIVAGLDAEFEGDVHLAHTDPGRLLTAMVFQEQSNFPWMTVRENVSYGLRMTGRLDAEGRRRVSEYIAKVGLARFENAYPHQLSGGMRQRASVARAFAADPEILLMDEPFGALDEQNKVLLHDELLRIWEETRKTVLFITHSIDEALVLSDRVVVMSARPGRIKDSFEVPFERPRSVMAVKGDPRYGQLFKRVWDALRDEVLRTRCGEERGGE